MTKVKSLSERICTISCYVANVMDGYQIKKYSEMEPGKKYHDSDFYRNYEDYLKLQEIYSMLADLHTYAIGLENQKEGE